MITVRKKNEEYIINLQVTILEKQGPLLMYYLMYLFVCDGESKLLNFFKHLSPRVVFLPVGKSDIPHILKNIHGQG